MSAARAMQVSRPGGPFELVECAIPQPGPRQVRIKVQACGLCHSDSLTKEGHWPGITYPRIPGHEIAGLVDAVGTEVPRWKPGQRWKETYRKMAKTFVRVGEPGTDRSWADPVGMELEIVAEEDPTAVAAGSPFALRVLRGGKALAGLAVAAEGPGRSSMRTTGADGRVSFILDEAGEWLIKGTLLEESKAADTDWDSLFTTLTVSVRPGR